MCGLFLIRRRLLKDRARLGRWGERHCERFLQNKGMRTLIRNYSCKLGELDTKALRSFGLSSNLA